MTERVYNTGLTAGNRALVKCVVSGQYCWRVVGNPYLITLRQSCPTRNATMRLYGSLVGAPKLCLLCEVVVVFAFIKLCANKRHTFGF